MGMAQNGRSGFSGYFITAQDIEYRNDKIHSRQNVRNERQFLLRGNKGVIT